MPAGTIGSKKARTRRNRRMSGQFMPAAMARPLTIADAGANGSVLTLTFNQAVILTGVPQITTSVADATAASAVRTSPTTVEITFSAAITAATSFTVPYEDPAIRNLSGGFVQPYVSFSLT